jgi:maltooligosyltrehalose synthase
MRSTNAVDKGKKAILKQLQELTADRDSHSQTLLGRFLQCQQLQMASALLAKAVEQCSRWHGGKRLQPPGASLPPSN